MLPQDHKKNNVRAARTLAVALAPPQHRSPEGGDGIKVDRVGRGDGSGVREMHLAGWVIGGLCRGVQRLHFAALGPERGPA